MSQNLNPRLFFFPTALFYFTEPFLFSQRASFSLRVSVMKARNLMAKDANGENISIQYHFFLCFLRVYPSLKKFIALQYSIQM